jgi:CubicO group peptidase (beta-lactamase class C family)
MRQLAGVLAILVLSAGMLRAQEPPPIEEEPSPTIDVVDLEAFLDGLIEARMDSFHVAGVTISVVHDGEMIFAKGYGYADLSSRSPVDPEATMFRPGSISKTFTWTAAMQLVEQGRLDLDADIRTYLLDLEIPETFPEPITFADLMAHTPGFEDSALGHLFGDDPGAVTPLIEYLRAYQPARVRPPGEVAAYSNYGVGVAGLILATITGMPFEDLIDESILEPLGMVHSTFREPWTNLELAPMPPQLLENMSSGYTRENGGFEPGDFELIHQVGPAGALSTTATDMARYMLMHLGLGTYDGVQILEPETARRMQRQHFANEGADLGLAHGFIEDRIHGYRVIGHGGGTLYYLSDMEMIPELGFGLFVSTNTNTGGELIGGLVDLVVGRYFPPKEEPAPVEPPSDFAERGKHLAGTYISNRRAYTLLEKLPMVFMSAVQVSVTEDGYLVLKTPGEAQRYVEVEPLVFREVQGDATLRFIEDSQGRITRIVPDIPILVFDRAGLFERPSTILVVSALALLLSIGVLIAAWYRRHGQVEQSGSERLASVMLGLTAATWILFFVLLGIAGSAMASIQASMFDFPPPTLLWALGVALLATVETVLSVVLLYPVWSKRSWSPGRRLRHTVVVLVLVVLVIMLNDLNVLGFKYF